MVLTKAKRLLSPFQSFVRSESASGILLVITAAVAFAWANSPWHEAYEHLKELSVSVGFGDWGLDKHLIHWVNDGLMALFFLFVGLEIKRELLVGELSNRRAAALPIAAALGGIVVPAMIYAAVNWGGAGIGGWGIPMATDIAFALGIMSLLGDRVPIALKVFLTALAIVDDLAAVLVIAVFYTEGMLWSYLLISLGLWAAALVYARLGGHQLRVFAILGIVMWYFMLKSGVHATVAGVLLAMAIPMRRQMTPQQVKESLAELFLKKDFEHEEVEMEHLEGLVQKAQSPLHELEHDMAPLVAYVIMPVFALFNAGFTLSADASLAAPISLGAFLGLLLGKPIGVAGAAWLAVRTGAGALPSRVSFRGILGAGFLAGIGFTMSLFIAALGFGGGAELDQAKLGVLAASVVSAFLGLAVLTWAYPKKAP
ncbi:MAG: Na+/H+ antiporter NhaA [Acidobacteriota bacterium]|nr:Na+/H+ antiporter NhaA [Acidobacteriota bacterium]